MARVQPELPDWVISKALAKHERSVDQAIQNAQTQFNSGTAATGLESLRKQVKDTIKMRRRHLGAVSRALPDYQRQANRSIRDFLSGMRIRGDPQLVIDSLVELEREIFRIVDLEADLFNKPDLGAFKSLACWGAILGLNSPEGDCMEAKHRLAHQGSQLTLPARVEHFLVSHFVLLDLLDSVEWQAFLPDSIRFVVRQNMHAVRGMYSPRMGRRLRSIWENKAFRSWLGTQSAVPRSVEPILPNHEKKYRVALSFPGERHRRFIASVARALADQLTEDAVFYDKFHEADLARPDLDIYLQSIYHDRSQLIAVFLCSDYERKTWCKLEWRAIRSILAARGKDIMPFRFDDAEIPGFFPLDGYIEVDGRAPEAMASLILQRLASERADLAPT